MRSLGYLQSRVQVVDDHLHGKQILDMLDSGILEFFPGSGGGFHPSFNSSKQIDMPSIDELQATITTELAEFHSLLSMCFLTARLDHDPVVDDLPAIRAVPHGCVVLPVIPIRAWIGLHRFCLIRVSPLRNSRDCVWNGNSCRGRHHQFFILAIPAL